MPGPELLEVFDHFVVSDPVKSGPEDAVRGGGVGPAVAHQRREGEVHLSPGIGQSGPQTKGGGGADGHVGVGHAGVVQELVSAALDYHHSRGEVPLQALEEGQEDVTAPGAVRVVAGAQRTVGEHVDVSGRGGDALGEGAEGQQAVARLAEADVVAAAVLHGHVRDDREEIPSPIAGTGTRADGCRRARACKSSRGSRTRGG